MTQKIFAYGSNLHEVDLLRWFTENGYPSNLVRDRLPAQLRECRLDFNYRSPVRAGGAANVVEARGKTVYGAILRGDDELLDAIDKKEGFAKRYTRVRRTLYCGEEKHIAWVYEVTPAYQSERTQAPTPHYLELVLGGLKSVNAPQVYLNEVKYCAQSGSRGA